MFTPIHISLYKMRTKCVNRKRNNRPHERDVEIGPISLHIKIHLLNKFKNLMHSSFCSFFVREGGIIWKIFKRCKQRERVVYSGNIDLTSF